MSSTLFQTAVAANHSTVQDRKTLAQNKVALRVLHQAMLESLVFLATELVAGPFRILHRGEARAGFPNCTSLVVFIYLFIF